MKAVPYADNLVILVSGICTTTIRSIMEGALRKVTGWASSCGLDVNPEKSGLLLFTTKTKILSFNLPQLNEVELTIAPKAKYFGIILKTKLIWKINIG